MMIIMLVIVSVMITMMVIVLVMIIMLVIVLVMIMMMTPQLAVFICGGVVLRVAIAERVVDGLAPVIVE